jgi:hypothetical protein
MGAVMGEVMELFVLMEMTKAEKRERERRSERQHEGGC